MLSCDPNSEHKRPALDLAGVDSINRSIHGISRSADGINHRVHRYVGQLTILVSQLMWPYGLWIVWPVRVSHL